MKSPNFGECVTNYLTIYLPGEAGLSENTIAAYSSTFTLIIQYAEEKCGLIAEKMTFKDFNSEFVSNFLSWLENERGCSIATRNQRLTSIRAFAKYVRKRNPGYLGESQKIADIKTKKKPKPLLSHLSANHIQEIISQADAQDDYGRRDIVLLSLMYDSAARVQEICDLCVGDIRFEKPYVAILTRKPNGKKQAVPIMDSTVNILSKYITENKLNAPGKTDHPLFTNHQRNKLTRAGVAYILKKYCDLARKENPAIPSRISPHVFRHSKAMHMLQAGVNLIYIRDFLGHEHVETTEIYAKADTEMKRKAIESAQITIDTELPDWAGNKPLMQLLTKLCGKK
jgi:site-specific recombinase XerD